MDKKLAKLIEQNHKMLLDIAQYINIKDLVNSKTLMNDVDKFSK